MSGSDVSGSDSDASERVSLDGLDMDGIKVNELCDSDDSIRLDSAHESNLDGQNWPEFNLENDISNSRLKVGMLFKSKDSLKEAVKQYLRLNSYFIKFLKNDLRRLKTVCNEKCSWFIWACRLNPNDPIDQTWQIRSSNPNHTCSKVYKNRNVTSAWIGAHKAQYEKIYEYLLEVKTQNEGTTTICYLDNRLFQRMYVCLQAYKDGYRAGCRRIVGLNGCFLKGYYGGYMLVAVGIDANNGIYPLAYAAVESENQVSWLWFLELLAIDLEIVISYQISFMFDKQKRLLEAICMLFLNAEIRHCVRHLHSNFKNAGFRTKELKDLLWKAARTSTTREFDDAMDELRKTNQHAYDWLKKKNPTHWSRSHFLIRSHSDMCVSSHAGGDKYQVECGPNSQHVVDLVQNSCSCRNWDLTGIPCMHALAVIHVKNEFLETYVQTWYTKQTQLQTCSNFVCPVRGPKQWASLSNMLPILPPPLRRPPRRPIKVRRKEPDEPQTTKRLSKRVVEMRCSKCKIIGHNKGSCKGKVGQNILVKRHQVGIRTQQQATPSQQEDNFLGNLPMTATVDELRHSH
ncbi:hypothetical protein PVK06_046752 [Gossypium arboreum]|uniref:SWIM-type domain-containing protein n=1 Tax=Gossypium arboreum TaxID=29729 RepID=A0ABR0MBJ3_GOSAR|nr:hypothetical protein PVK06_046752 [Gossypium arboreum]